MARDLNYSGLIPTVTIPDPGSKPPVTIGLVQTLLDTLEQPALDPGSVLVVGKIAEYKDGYE